MQSLFQHLHAAVYVDKVVVWAISALCIHVTLY